MNLLDNDSIILSLEKAAEISLGIMEIIGIESTDDYYKGAKATYESVIEAFKKQEEFVDAVPVVHGHWEREENARYSCSNCHALKEQYHDLFCGNCGAKMDEDGEQE